MSLDVMLYLEGLTRASEGIIVRRDGQNVEISPEEFDESYPGRGAVIVAEEGTDQVYWANITHNLSDMARECRLYEPLWTPEIYALRALAGKTEVLARDLIAPIRTGLKILVEDPVRFHKFNPENGWGSYDLLVKFATGYLAACQVYPDARVEVSR